MRCAKCSSSQHATNDCDSTEQYCFACQSPHSCSSIRCKFYKAALAIAAQVQAGSLQRANASLLYASLYSNPDKVLSAPPLVTPSPGNVIVSTQLSPSVALSSMQTWPKLATNNFPSLPPCSLLSTPTHPTSSALSHHLTSAQKIPKNPTFRPTPPHLTPEYSRALKGDLWYTSQGPCLPPYSSPHLPTSSPSPAPSPSFPASPPQEQTSPESESSIYTLLKSLFKPLLLQLLNWILSFLRTDSPTAAIFSTLLHTLSVSLSSSS